MLVLGTKGMPTNNLLQNEKRYRRANRRKEGDPSRRAPTADERAEGIGGYTGLKRVYDGKIPGEELEGGLHLAAARRGWGRLGIGKKCEVAEVKYRTPAERRSPDLETAFVILDYQPPIERSVTLNELD